MTRKDLLELKRRLKKEECAFTRMTGCYVSGNKEKVVTFSESFLNLPDEEFFKYLEIAKKALSGTLGNNQLQLFFTQDEEQAGGKHQFYMGLNKSGLKDDGLLQLFYDLVIENYDYAGNFLILLFHDAYDVMEKATDNRKLDESAEVYEYTICAICPVTLSKPGLGYLEEENKIGLRLRDWVVAPPENGFVYPAFSERSSDIHSFSYYTKNAKDPRPEFMEKALGVTTKRTSTQQKKAFENVVKKAVMGTDQEENSQEIFLALQENICDRVQARENEPGREDPIEMNEKEFASIMEECEIDEYLAPRLAQAYEEEFGAEPPAADDILDTKALAKNQPKKLQKELMGEVAELKQTLARVSESSLPTPEEALSGEPLKPLSENALLCDIFLRVKPEKASGIRSEIIDGQNCIVIPVSEDDDIDINGLKTLP
ncbi:MAG: DUF4317 domain-containing protein [Lachnospiraceae bacterium]|nr:DUF4317 domain-containing protein [Lachnospiraceae bacterium]